MPLHDFSQGGAGFALICSQVLGASQSTFDTQTILGGNSIRGDYNHLRIILYARLDDAAANETVALRFNNDSGANYDAAGASSNTSTVAAEGSFGQTSLIVAERIPASTAPSGNFGVANIDIPMYAGTVGNKSVLSFNHESHSTSGTSIATEIFGGTWRSSSAVTRITLIDQNGGNFIAGSAFFLYGV